MVEAKEKLKENTPFLSENEERLSKLLYPQNDKSYSEQEYELYIVHPCARMTPKVKNVEEMTERIYKEVFGWNSNYKK